MRMRLASFLLLLCCALPGHAQFPQYVGIKAAEFNFVASAQQQDEWCWAASIQMILNYYRIPVTQAEIVQHTFGAVIDHTASDQNISAALNGWAIGLGGVPRIIRSVAAAGAPNPAILLNQLSQDHPILLTFATGPSSGHVVVITAASFFQTPAGPQIQSLVIRDPWPSPVNVANQGRAEISGVALAQFAQTIRSYWTISVQ